MNAFFIGVTPEEKENILNRHKQVYNGFRTLNPNPVENEQPLYTQDFANDKVGLVVNNKGEVKPYTNMGINESKKQKTNLNPKKDDKLFESNHMCEQCGLNEEICECGVSEAKQDEVCEQCGEMEEDMGDDASSVEPAYQFQSHGPEDVYGTLKDYDSEHPHHDYNSMEDVEEYDPSSDLSNMFGNLSDGMAYGDTDSDTFQYDAGDMNRMGDEGLGQDTENDMDLSNTKSAYDFESDGALTMYEDDIEEEMDDDLKESFIAQKNKINEMFNRFKKYI